MESHIPDRGILANFRKQLFDPVGVGVYCVSLIFCQAVETNLAGLDQPPFADFITGDADSKARKKSRTTTRPNLNFTDDIREAAMVLVDRYTSVIFSSNMPIYVYF